MRCLIRVNKFMTTKSSFQPTQTKAFNSRIAGRAIAYNGIDGLHNGTHNTRCTAAPVCAKCSNAICCCGTAMIHQTSCCGTALHTRCTMAKTIDRTKKPYPTEPHQQAKFRPRPSLILSMTLRSRSFPTIPCKVVTITSQNAC
jgi:hypothetical protein